jgi:hypothetical protein
VAVQCFADTFVVKIATSPSGQTLEEALLVCKGKALINLDKSYEFFNQVYDVAKKQAQQNK